MARNTCEDMKDVHPNRSPALEIHAPELSSWSCSSALMLCILAAMLPAKGNMTQGMSNYCLCQAAANHVKLLG